MLGDGAGAHPEQDQRAGRERRSTGDSSITAPRRLGEQLARAGLAPVAAVGRDRHRLGPVELAPDPADEPEAVAADAA